MSEQQTPIGDVGRLACGAARRGVVLIGAGGSGREAVEVVQAIAASGGPWELLGFLDDGAALTGGSVGGALVLGPIDDARRLHHASFVVCTGSPTNYSSRQRIVCRLGLPSHRYASLVHPAASLAGSVELGHGCLVQAGVVATVDVTIGDHVLVMPGVVFTHDDLIEDFVTIGAGASSLAAFTSRSGRTSARACWSARAPRSARARSLAWAASC